MVKVDLVRHLFPKDPEKTIVIADKKELFCYHISYKIINRADKIGH